MATEREELRATNRVDTLANWMKAGTNEGISFQISRLTDDLFTDSFLGGGDASRFTASGRRGKLTSQLSNGYILASGGGVPQLFPVQFTFNLTGKATGSWNNPVTNQAETVTVTLTFFKTATRPEDKCYLFYGDRSSDKAGYTITFSLL
jgi:hypothetical protein